LKMHFWQKNKALTSVVVVVQGFIKCTEQAF